MCDASHLHPTAYRRVAAHTPPSIGSIPSPYTPLGLAVLNTNSRPARPGEPLRQGEAAYRCMCMNVSPCTACMPSWYRIRANSIDATGAASGQDKQYIGWFKHKLPGERTPILAMGGSLAASHHHMHCIDRRSVMLSIVGYMGSQCTVRVHITHTHTANNQAHRRLTASRPA